MYPTLLEGRFVRLEVFEDRHREGVRQALDHDPDNWAIQAMNGYGEAFDGWWEAAVRAQAAEDRTPFAVRRLSDARIVGTTSVFERPGPKCVEVGATIYEPSVRGGYVNPETKLLLVGALMELGMLRVEFTVDARNAVSQAAMSKLGAVREGVLRNHKITWTGHLRDSVIYSIIPSDWPAIRDGLERRLAAFGA
jgi:RimJ/RimL family protein N-acetyltransferase